MRKNPEMCNLAEQPHIGIVRKIWRSTLMPRLKEVLAQTLPQRQYAYSRLPKRMQLLGDSFRTKGNKQFRRLSLSDKQPVIAGDGDVVCTCGKHVVAPFGSSSLGGRQVTFLWNPMRGIPGSTELRVRQTARRLAFFYGDGFVSTCSSLSPETKRIRDSVVVLHKGHGLPARAVKRLKYQGNVVATDYVDGPHDRRLDNEVDGFICSSATEFLWLQDRTHKSQIVALVPHSADDVFSKFRGRSRGLNFRVGYFGTIRQGLFVDELNRLGILDLAKSRQVHRRDDFGLAPEWIQEVLQVPVAYIARPSNQLFEGRFKPFTKGFQAAVLGQIVIGARYDYENRFWLGDEYPFLVEDETAKSAVSTIELCRLAWGSSKLDAALARMQYLVEMSCPVRNALDYREAFSRLLR